MYTTSHSLYLFLLEELHIRECSDNILSDQLLRVIALEETVPGVLGLGGMGGGGGGGGGERERERGGKGSSNTMVWNVHLLPVREGC